MSNSPLRYSCQVTYTSPLPVWLARRRKSLVRIHRPGMPSSGPRPKSHTGSLTITSSPTLVGAAQLRWAVPAAESPVGEQVTASCWRLGLSRAVLALLNGTTRSPLGSTVGSEPWLLLHSAAGRDGSKKLPVKHSRGLAPLISSGVDQVNPWSVDIEPKMGDRQNAGTSGVPPRQLGSNRNTVQVT